MAIEFRHASFTIPAGTAQATPVTQTVTFPPRIVEQIDIKVPAGSHGQMGFAIGNSGVPVIPLDPGQFIIADDDYITLPLDNFWNSGSWELFGFNTGQYPHTIYLTFHCQLVPPPAPPATVLASNQALSSTVPPVGGLATAGASTGPTAAVIAVSQMAVPPVISIEEPT